MVTEEAFLIRLCNILDSVSGFSFVQHELIQWVLMYSITVLYCYDKLRCHLFHSRWHLNRWSTRCHRLENHGSEILLSSSTAVVNYFTLLIEKSTLTEYFCITSCDVRQQFTINFIWCQLICEWYLIIWISKIQFTRFSTFIMLVCL